MFLTWQSLTLSVITLVLKKKTKIYDIDYQWNIVEIQFKICPLSKKNMPFQLLVYNIFINEIIVLFLYDTFNVWTSVINNLENNMIKWIPVCFCKSG